MAEIFELMNQHLSTPAGPTKRFWVEPGYPIKLNDNVWMHIFIDRTDAGYIPRAEITKPTYPEKVNLEITDSTWLDLVQICGLMAIPRGMEVDQQGVPKRMLMEFLIVDRRLRWVG